MLKWVQERFSGMALRRDRRMSAVGPEMTDHQVVDVVALAVTRHVTAISSTLYSASSVRQSPAVKERFSGSSMLAQRRPGVHARWKEKNRLPMQSM
jgi:hypothetical protein